MEGLSPQIHSLASLKHEVKSWQNIWTPHKGSFPRWAWNGVQSAPPNMEGTDFTQSWKSPEPMQPNQ